MEYYCTLFNHAFLPLGLALHASMMRRCGDFHLLILCVDSLVEEQLRKLDLPRVSLLSLGTLETDELLAVKGDRTLAEYCWTLTPYTFVFAKQVFQHLKRLTYLDADLFFFDHPGAFFEEFDVSKKSVLITEHAYAPEYDRTATSGRFCVQFLTVTYSEPATRVIEWWRERCLEWCFDRIEEGRFGDQKYLDLWPERFPDAVHILGQQERTLAPWNIDHFGASRGTGRPVFYHFHGYRIASPRWARCFAGYRIGRRNQWVYAEYRKAVREALRSMRGAGLPVPCLPVDPPRMIARHYFRKMFIDHTTRWEYLG